MFVRPRLFTWLVEFVAWHHAWYWAAFLLSVATLLPDLIRSRSNTGARAARWVAVGYVIFFGLVGVYLLGTPYLTLLSSGDRSLALVPGALLPLLWLALVDHLAAGRRALSVDARLRTTGQRRLLLACVSAGGFLWLAHQARDSQEPSRSS